MSTEERPDIEQDVDDESSTPNHQGSEDNQQSMTESLTCSQLSWKIIVWIVSLLVIIVNTVVDILTLIAYYDSDEFVYFSLTLAFLIVPSLLIAVASLVWWWDEDKMISSSARAERGQVTAISCLLHVMLLGPVYRYGHLIVKTSSLRNNSEQLMSWERDAHLLTFIQTILHSCSQLVLQLYIIGEDSDGSSYIFLSITCTVVNVVAVTWALSTYSLSNRFKQTNKISWTSRIVIFIWYFCVVVSRVLGVAFFAIAFDGFVFIPVGIHWALWTVVLFFLSTEFCVDLSREQPKKRLYLELPFDAVIGFVLVFLYFNVKKGRTWCIVAPYYSVTFVENIVLVVTFYIELPNKWYSELVLVTGVALFLLGSLLMVMYYTVLHPHTKDRWMSVLCHMKNHHRHTKQSTDSTTQINNVQSE